MNTEQAEARRLMTRALHHHVGVGRPHSYEELAEATGISLSNLYNFKAGKADPKWFQLNTMIRVLGLSFSSMLNISYGLTGVARVDDTLPPETLIVHATRFAHEYTYRIADGELCHRDVAHIWPFAVDLADAANGAVEVWGRNGAKQ